MDKHIVESPFYSKSFDGAIFDGPFRIYFAQYQERCGLELYNHLSVKLRAVAHQIKKSNRDFKRKVFIFIYPNQETKLEYQPGDGVTTSFIVPFQSDYILGLCASDFHKNPSIIDSYVQFIADNWLGSAPVKIKILRGKPRRQ